MIMKDRRPYLARLLAVDLVLLAAGAMNAARAEDAAPVSIHSGKGDSSSIRDAPAKGIDKTTPDEHANDKVDSNSRSTGEHHTGSKDGVKGGEETSSGGVRHGEDHSRVKRNGTESNPIDTRITLFNRPRSGHALNTLDRKQDKIARPSGISDHDRVLIHTNTDRVVRNAIGQRVHQVRANAKGSDKKSLKASSVEGYSKSVGAVENGGGGAGGPDPRHQGFVPLPARDGKLHDLPLNTVLNHSIINGTGMARPASRMGAIGDATKNVAGVINGTDFRPRHP
jgi:hypothetical protein